MTVKTGSVGLLRSDEPLNTASLFRIICQNAMSKATRVVSMRRRVLPGKMTMSCEERSKRRRGRKYAAQMEKRCLILREQMVWRRGQG
jgi:hypothetical protein